MEEGFVDKSQKKSVKNMSVTSSGCFVCQSDHRIFQCEKFKKMTVDEVKLRLKAIFRLSCVCSLEPCTWNWFLGWTRVL